MPTPPVAEAISVRQNKTPHIAKTKHSRIYVPPAAAPSTCARIRGPQALLEAAEPRAKTSGQKANHSLQGRFPLQLRRSQTQKFPHQACGRFHLATKLLLRLRAKIDQFLKFALGLINRVESFSFDINLDLAGFNQLTLALHLGDSFFGTLDRKAKIIKQVFDQQRVFNIGSGIHALLTIAFARRQQRKLRFPIAQNIRLHADNVGDFANSKKHSIGNTDRSLEFHGQGFESPLPPLPPVAVFTSALKTCEGLKVSTRRAEILIAVPV